MFTLKPLLTIRLRFIDALTNRRRETQEKLAETALEEASRQRREQGTTQQNGSAISTPTTPAFTPTAAPQPTTAIREGTVAD